MPAGFPSPGERVRGALGAIAVQGLLAWLLVSGLAVQMARPSQPGALRLLDFALPPPPQPEPVPEPARKAAAKPEGAAAPPNRTSRATEVVQPTPVPIPLPVIIAAPKPASGSDATSGNAPVIGPGTGAGGNGNGTGSGRAGNGPGGGEGTVLRWLRGELTPDDYPRAALRVGASGTVGLRFTVGVSGRVTDCTVTRSSGNAALDETTCRLIMRRFRYEPSRDAQGRPYPDTVTGEHIWELWDRPYAE